MLLNFKRNALSLRKTFNVTLDCRLPSHIEAPCVLESRLAIENFSTHCLLTMETTGELNLICQRCLHSFIHAYHNQITLAICYSDEKANELMNGYESVMSENGEVDLVDLLTDELHLYSPNKHLNSDECGSDRSGCENLCK